jgi:hypothetical protein
MARAVYMQAGIVRDNVLELIRGGSPSHQYSPQLWIEGSIQLTIGKVSSNWNFLPHPTYEISRTAKRMLTLTMCRMSR